MILDDEDGKIKEVVERILLHPKNVSTPKEMYQQANACMKALISSDVNQDGVVSTNEIASLSELMGLPISSDEDTQG